VIKEFVNEPTGATIGTHTIFETLGSPAPPRPPAHTNFMDLGVPVGVARWIVVQWPPGLTGGMHYTDTVDFDTVLGGSIDLVLDDGHHRLEAGDCAVVTGVDHAWEAGPDGCTTVVLLVGTPAPA
jgi:quercetin dioxygenase-like cupin family protein